MSKNPLQLMAFMALAISFLALGLALTDRNSVAPALTRIEPAAGENLYTQVSKRGELRCGYVTYAPYLQKNLETGQLEGPIFDLIEELGRTLQIKIIWAEETDFNTMIQSLEAGRFDAMCSLAWQDVNRAARVEFSVPVLYNILNAYARPDFAKNISLGDLNTENIKFSALEGSPDLWVIEKRFPRATVLSSASQGQVAKTLLDVVTHKADVALTEPAVMQNFLKTNPDSLRQIGQSPVQVFPLVMLLPLGEPELKNWVDAGFRDILNRDGLTDILNRYPEVRENIKPVSPGYQTSSY